jgi:hypothetical protein
MWFLFGRFAAIRMWCGPPFYEVTESVRDAPASRLPAPAWCVTGPSRCRMRS